jgi:hypothetical protein
MDDQLKNFIPLNREIFEDPLWAEKRSLTKFEAWLYLIKEARFDYTPKKQLMAGKLVTWGRGQVAASIRFLGSQWLWDKAKVHRFLKFLVSDGKIILDINKESGQTVITLVNYEKYNAKPLLDQHFGESPKKRDNNRDSKRDIKTLDSKEFQTNDETPTETTTETAARQRRDNTNTVNNENTVNNYIDTQNELNIPFETVWELYDKKIGLKEKLRKKWERLSNEERALAIKHIPKYKASQPDKNFRKNFETYLNNKSFNDEIINYGKDKRIDSSIGAPGTIITYD